MNAPAQSTANTASGERVVCPSMEPAFRASRFVARLNRAYPKAWKMADEARKLLTADDVIAHGEMSFLPVETWKEIARRGHSVQRHAITGDPEKAASEGTCHFQRRAWETMVIPLAAAATWNKEKVINDFDATVYEEVTRTPVTGVLPGQLLMHPRHWAEYIATPSMKGIDGSRIFGAFVFLLRENATGQIRWTFVLDTDAETFSYGALPLGPWSLAQVLEQVAKRQGLLETDEVAKKLTAFRQKVVEPLMSLYLYLCSKSPDLIGEGVDNFERPRPVKTKRGPRYFGPEQPRTWQVGVRIGAAIRKARLQPKLDTTADAGSHASPRGHVRCAHWHHYWVGPRNSSDRKAELRWIHPTLVNVEDPNLLPTVIRPVKAANDD